MTDSCSISRIFDGIVTQIKAGSRRFYLHGALTKDEFFFNAEGEISDLIDSLVFHLLRSPKVDVDKVVILSSDGAVLCQKNHQSFDKQRVNTAASVTEFLTGIRLKGRDGLSGLASKKQLNRDTSSTEEHGQDEVPANKKGVKKKVERETSNLNFMITVLNALSQSATEISEKYALVFDSFNWEAKLFSKQNHEFDLLRKALKFGEQSEFRNPPFCFYILDRADALEDYVAGIDDLPTTILIGLPGIEEIHGALYNFFNEDYSVRELEKVAKTSRSAQMRLRETINTVNELVCSGIENKRLDEQFRQNIGFPLENWDWNSIYLAPATKARIISYFDAHRDKKDGEKQKSLGLIFYGPAGTGKTTIAKVLANTEKRSLITAKLADLKGAYIGQTAPKVKALFNSVRSAAPSLLFLDEIETLFPSRVGNDGDSYTKDLVTQFLAESDGIFSNNQDFVIVGATNFIDLVDPAVLSRLTPIAVELPNNQARENILRANLSKYWDVFSAENVADMVSRTSGCSGRDLKNNLIEVIERSFDSTEQSPDNIVKHALESLKDNIGSSLQQGGNGFRLKKFRSDGVRLRDIIGHEGTKRTLVDEIHFLLEPSELRSMGIPVENGFLLYGPPGNGKTQLANAVANEFSLDMVEVNLGDVVRGRNNVVANLNDIFDRTARYSVLSSHGVILFFDEFDALAAQGMGQFRDTFLKRIDSIRSGSERIVLMAATNFRHKLDEAIIRFGRFDNHLLMENPFNNEVVQIFQLCLPEQFVLSDELTAEVLEELFASAAPEGGYSYSDAKGITHKIAKNTFNSTTYKSNPMVVEIANIRNVLAGR